MRIFMYTLMAAAAISANATALSDTITVSHPDEVKITTASDTLSISILGKQDEPNYFYNKTVIMDSNAEEITTTSRNVRSGLGWDFSLIESKKSRTLLDLLIKANIYAGWNFLLDKPTAMKTNPFLSPECGIDLFHLKFHPRTDKWWISLDFGALLSWYEFKNCMMTTEQDGTVSMKPFPEESTSQSSKFMTISGALSLMWHYRIYKTSSLGLGVVWIPRVTDNCNYKTKYALSDGTAVTDMNELPINRNLVSIKAEYLLGNKAGLYIRYTPTPILKKGKAPHCQQINVGVQLNL